MSEPKSTESLGSGCGVPALRSAQWGPEMVSVKLEDCSQTLELNVIVKEEVEERGVKEEEENMEVSAPDLEEEEEEVDSITDPGESSNPGSDSESSSPASGNHKQHRRRNSRQKHHHCMDCFTSFYDPEELRRHTCRPHPCSDCRGSFICPTHLIPHQQTLKTKKPYTCGQCGKRFQTPSILKTHQLTHTGKKPFHCSQCGKTFDSSLHLKRHHKIHTVEKPFHCAQCGKSFSDEGNRSKHQRIHTGEKPHQSSECGKSFNQLSHLKMAEKSRAPVWDYYIELAPGKARCLICDKDVSMGSAMAKYKNTTNLWNHLKNAHPKAHKEAKMKKANANSSQGKCDTDTSQTSQATLLQLFNKQAKWQDKDPRAKKMDEAIIEMIATDNQPFTVVSDVGFQRLITLAEPRYRIKEENLFRTEMLDKTHERVVMKVKNLVAPLNAPHMAFTTDCWSGTTESLMSLTGHFIDNVWTRKQVVLNVKTMTGSHTGNYIREMFLTILEYWEIHTERVVLVLRDSGANMVKGMRLVELPDFSCSAHTLQLVINDGLSSQRAVLDIIAMLKSCATHFDHSVLAKQRLRAIQEELGLPKHSIIQAVQTRWNSTLHMLQRMFEQRRALKVYAGEYGHIGSLSAAQWNIVSNLIETLAPMEEVTLEMSHSNSTAACIIPSVSVLKLMLQQEGSSTRGIKTTRKTMLDSLTRRFSKAEETKCLVLATVLDPRYKSYAFSSGTALEKAKEWLKEESDLLRKPNPRATADGTSEEVDPDPGAKRQRVQVDQPPSLVDSLYARILGSQEGRAEVQCSFEIALERYLTEPVIDRKSGLPLEWWKQNEDRFQSLAPLAKKFLCPPPSSVPSERVFSEVGIIYDKQRSRLTGEHADKLCFLHYNLKLLNWEY
ncbi:uncharacterized protein [Salvelinus alpinus]|uniref:uncharacterized protein isoform X1 n=1 Tax=Salvelinus alpinus TaxID=8036 RepID=UPI0039FCCC3F